jgi:hypothetical protein
MLGFSRHPISNNVWYTRISFNDLGPSRQMFVGLDKLISNDFQSHSANTRSANMAGQPACGGFGKWHSGVWSLNVLHLAERSDVYQRTSAKPYGGHNYSEFNMHALHLKLEPVTFESQNVQVMAHRGT